MRRQLESAGRLTAAGRRGSADAISAPVDLQGVPLPVPAQPASSDERPDAKPSPAPRTAPSSVRSAPRPSSLINPLSPDMSNLSPIHAASRQIICVPEMLPLPDAALVANAHAPFDAELGANAHAPFDDVALSPSGRSAAQVLSQLTGTKRGPKQEAEREPSDDDADADDRGKKLRGSRCGTCANCLQPDCGVCSNCKDKPKFMGRGVKKQACEKRKCLAPNLRSAPAARLPNAPTPTTPTTIVTSGATAAEAATTGAEGVVFGEINMLRRQ